MTDQPPAGWYEATDRPGQLRYFDGAGWTEHYAPSGVTTQLGPPTGAHPHPPQPYPQPQGGFPKWAIALLAGLGLAALIAIVVIVVSSSSDDDVTTSEPTTTEADDPTTTDEEPTTTEDPTTTDEDPTTTDDSTPTPGSGANPAFGEAYEWEDGLTVSVSEATSFTPTDTAAGGEGAAAYVAFEITIVNGTSENYDPIEISISLQSGSTEGDQVFDTAQGFDGAPSTTVLPDRDVVFMVGFGVDDPDDLVAQVTPGFDYEPAVFTSS